VKVPSYPYKRGRKGTCKRIQTFWNLCYLQGESQSLCALTLYLNVLRTLTCVRAVIRTFRVTPSNYQMRRGVCRGPLPARERTGGPTTRGHRRQIGPVDDDGESGTQTTTTSQARDGWCFLFICVSRSTLPRTGQERSRRRTAGQIWRPLIFASGV
jgi:hypothetical protein